MTEGRGSITASCGCKVNSADDMLPVVLAEYSCDAEQGFLRATAHHSWCPACEKKSRKWRERLYSEAQEDVWFKHGKLPDGNGL